MSKVEIDGRLVKGYFANFDTIDSHGDMFVKGAFDESLALWGVDGSDVRRIKHLAYHDQTKIVGVIQKLSVDEKGLFFETLLDETTLGNDSLIMYKSGSIMEHSVGYRNQDYEVVSVDDAEKTLLNNGKNDMRAVNMWGEYVKLKKVQLFEGSYVAFGSNRFTQNLTNVKSENQLKELNEMLLKQIDLVEKCISDCTIVEFLELEMVKLKDIQKQIIEFEPEKIEPKNIIKFEPLNFM